MENKENKGVREMTGIDNVITIHSDKYDIDIKKYLGYDEIQDIIMTTLPIENYNERIKNVDMMLLHFAAGIPIETLMNTDPDNFLQSGLIDEVKNFCENWYEIEMGIKYHTSVSKLLYQITSNWPEIQKGIMNNPQFKEMMKNGNH